jgi:serine O-acetyltransferase
MKALGLLIFGCVVPPEASVGRETKLGYRGVGIVVHARAVIGAGCVIGPSVTIGGRSGLRDVPVIGDDVFVGAGARILGPVRIGDGAVIGANAVVIHDVPPGCVAAGVPASIVKRDVDVTEYATMPRYERS